MHVLLIHQSFVSLTEPGGTRHFELASYLAQKGHQVTVIASQVSYLTGTKITSVNHPEVFKHSQKGSVTILRTYTYPSLHRSFVLRVFSFISFMASSFLRGLSTKKVDLVWGTSPPIFQGITALSLARLKGVPFLFEVRDLWPAFAVAAGVLRQPLLIRASEWLERFLYNQADQIIVNSPGFIAHLHTKGARKVELVPNGADTSMFNPNEDGAVFRHVHSLENKFIVLYAGAHGFSNDLDVILEAADILRQDERVAFVLIGDGKEKPNLMTRAHSLQLTNVHFIPPLPKQNMPQALAAADACIGILKPISLYATVFPNKVFDYMAAGRPVVLVIDGVIREVVEQAEAGLWSPPGNAQALAQTVQRLVNNQSEGRQMGMRGRRYVELHYNRTHIADKLVRLLETLVSQG